MSDLERGIRRYYTEKEMPAARAEAILGRGKRQVFWRRPYQILSVAAVLLLFCVGAYDSIEQAQYKGRVLAEIAMNHRKDLGVEFESAEYKPLREALDRLDFDLEPTAVRLAGLALVGGRYCSIQGQIAAQLKVVDPASKEILTLYVTRIDDELEQLAPLDERYEDLYMRCWRDGERFFALAGYLHRED
ncbi:MAG: hypothetical protein ACKVJG_08360 [Candidatus Latescibacterota bacterium]|jgi:hypothetical protein